MMYINGSLDKYILNSFDLELEYTGVSFLKILRFHWVFLFVPFYETLYT